MFPFISTGDFSVTIRNISKDKYSATAVKRSVKNFLKALIEGLPEDATVLESVLEWRVVKEAELTASESAEGTLVTEGTAEWVINRRFLPAGIYQVKFTASFQVGDAAFSRTLLGFDYGFIEVIAGPLRAVIDGGSIVRWGSNETVNVNGSLSYDENIGPGNHTGLNFTWSCLDPAENVSVSFDCYGAFLLGNDNSPVIRIDTRRLIVGKTYLLRLSLSKDTRCSSTEMSFEIAAGEILPVTLR